MTSVAELTKHSWLALTLEVKEISDAGTAALLSAPPHQGEEDAGLNNIGGGEAKVLGPLVFARESPPLLSSGKSTRKAVGTSVAQSRTLSRCRPPLAWLVLILLLTVQSASLRKRATKKPIDSRCTDGSNRRTRARSASLSHTAWADSGEDGGGCTSGDLSGTPCADEEAGDHSTDCAISCTCIAGLAAVGDAASAACAGLPRAPPLPPR